MGKATPHPAGRQPCGYKSAHQRGAIARPWYQSLQNRWVILEGRERSWGWVLGLSFLCSVVCFVSLLCVATCLCVLFGSITLCSNSLF
jgi:hypothetical protein